MRYFWEEVGQEDGSRHQVEQAEQDPYSVDQVRENKVGGIDGIRITVRHTSLGDLSHGWRVSWSNSRIRFRLDYRVNAMESVFYPGLVMVDLGFISMWIYNKYKCCKYRSIVQKYMMLLQVVNGHLNTISFEDPSNQSINLISNIQKWFVKLGIIWLLLTFWYFTPSRITIYGVSENISF